MGRRELPGVLRPHSIRGSPPSTPTPELQEQPPGHAKLEVSLKEEQAEPPESGSGLHHTSEANLTGKVRTLASPGPCTVEEEML